MRNIEFINAGAGSGKTFFLTSKLEEVLRNGSFNANEVILTTFTEKAAADLKNKAREALLKAGMDYQANLLSMAAIGTIHSVAYMLIRDYWQYLGLGVDLKVLAPEDKELILRQSLALIPSDYEIHQLEDIIRKLDMRSSKANFTDYNCWKKDILTLMEKTLNYRIIDFQPSLKYSMDEIDRIFHVDGSFNPDHHSIRTLLDQIRHVCECDKPSKSRDDRIKICKKINRNIVEWGVGEYQELHSFLTKKLSAKISQNVDNLDEVIASLAGLYNSPLVNECMKTYTTLLFSIAEKGVQYFSRYKQEHKLIDYSDMEAFFLKLLEHETARDEIRNRFRCVFIDEFQDSSPMQVAIFIKLSDLVQKSYWVGDPKQAIYDFRGTDPQLIEAVLEKFKSINTDNLLIGKRLEKSWRSRPQIVELNNTIFETVLEDQVDANSIALTPVRTDNELPDDENHYPIRHWKFDGTKKEEFYNGLSGAICDFIHSPVNVVSKRDSKISINSIENLIVRRGIKPSDIAVLCRRKDTAEDITRELKKRGLQVACEQQGLVKTPEIRLAISFLNYFLDKDDSLARACILLLTTPEMTTSELIDKRLEFLYGQDAVNRPDENADAETTARYFEYINSWGQGDQTDDKIFKVLNSIIADSKHLSVRSIVEKTIILTGLNDIVSCWLNPLQRKNNLETFRNIAGQYEDRCITMGIAPSVRGFIDALSGYGSDVLKQSEAAGDDAVNMMTYHKSKGLEWPVVILTELSYDHFSIQNLINKGFFGVNVYNSEVINLDNPFQGKLISILPWPMGDIKRNLPDEITNHIIREDRFLQHSNRCRKEAKRLLYVGMTRARDMLIIASRTKDTSLTWIDDLYKDSNGNHYRMQGGDNIFHTNDIIPTRLPDLTETGVFQRHMVTLFDKNGPVSQTEPLIINPSKAVMAENISAEIKGNFVQRIPRNDIDGISDETMGNCIHHIFYHYKPVLSDEECLQTIATAIGNFGLTGEFPSPEHILFSIKNLHKFLQKTYGPAIKIYKELPMNLFMYDKIYKGQADLLWETEDDLVLVDYKSYSGAITNVTDKKNDQYSGKYAGQLACYAEMIKKSHPHQKAVTATLIYYPVLGAIVELNYSLIKQEGAVLI